MPVGQMPVGRATVFGPEHYIYTRAGLPEYVVSTMSGPPAGYNIGQNIDKGHAPNPRTEIKIPDPAGNRTQAAGLEDRDSTDHATAMDESNSLRYFF